MKIAVGDSRFTKKWRNKEMSWEEFCRQISIARYTTETVEEYRKMPKSQRDTVKDVGGFVGGHLREGLRRSGHVLCRSMVTLDMDFGTPGILDELKKQVHYRMCIYSTHKHTPEAPRLRLIIPLKRDVSSDEYPAIARKAAQEIGIELFDDSTYEVERLMYWPSTSADGEYVYEVLEGDLLDPDIYLAKYDNWKDTTAWPVSSRVSEVIKNPVKKVEDPLTKKGIVGVFCRTYGIHEAIGLFLSNVYEPSVRAGRYDYIPGEGSAGVQIIEGKFAYSFHATDPACGKLLNAFDLVRVHKFPDEDPKKSFTAMAKFAREDEGVRLKILDERQKEAADDFADDDTGDWRKKLTYDKQMKVENTRLNIERIIENDENLKGIVLNQLADAIEIQEEVPWKHQDKFWRDFDDAQLIMYMEKNYGVFSKGNYEVAVAKVMADRAYHPIRDYFEKLSPWDGTERVETLLVDYLGAEDCLYVREVTRKLLCAAYNRIYHPGIKFDNLIVLNGKQGIGKSTLISKLGMEWYSDSLNLSDMNDKTAAEKLQGYWILEIGELAGMRKADLDKVKAFISRQDDKYRASFGRRVTPHPRQCVFFGTTNNEDGYLRDITGNRRYWNVKVTGNGKLKPWDLDQETVNQIWAEVKTLAEAGEPLFLSPEVEEYAKEEQREAMELDDREGLVRNFLEMLLPENWESMDLTKRMNYLSDGYDPMKPKGVERRTYVCNYEIWTECFGRELGKMEPKDTYYIKAIMKRIENWERTEHYNDYLIYGRQRIYVRKENKPSDQKTEQFSDQVPEQPSEQV